MFISQPPCGDACLLPGQVAKRTGAKLVEGAAAVPGQSHVEADSAQQQLGAVRRKPGKGPATLSMSCSDKLARWALLGCQGALLSSLLSSPLYIDAFAIAQAWTLPAAGSDALAQVDHDSADRHTPGTAADQQLLDAVQAAAERAVIGRTEVLRCRLQPPFEPHRPSIRVVQLKPQAQRQLHLSPVDAGSSPCPASVHWYPANIDAEGQLSTCHGVFLGNLGRPAGATKQAIIDGQARSMSMLCKSSMLRQRHHLMHLLSLDYKDAMAASAADRIDAESYRALKERTAYWQQWQLLKEEPSPFSPWIAKAPEQEGFS